MRSSPTMDSSPDRQVRDTAIYTASIREHTVLRAYGTASIRYCEHTALQVYASIRYCEHTGIVWNQFSTMHSHLVTEACMMSL